MESSPTATQAPSRWAGLGTRAVSGVVMAAVVLCALWVGGWVFNLLVVAAALQMIREWDALTDKDPGYCRLAGLAYVAAPAASLVWLRQVQLPGQPQAGAALVLYVLLVVCATDIGAFFAGRRIGGPKLAPVISPNKTWAGLGGGMVAAAIAGGLCANVTPYPPSWIAAMDMGIVIALVSQGGDLFESWLKRRVGAKDSGTLIPGHGGLLDRVDGLIFTLPLFALMLHLSGSLQKVAP
jgi:phosphatidate cytidylyltransferase